MSNDKPLLLNPENFQRSSTSKLSIIENFENSSLIKASKHQNASIKFSRVIINYNKK